MIHTGLAAINQSVLRTALALVSDKWIRHGSMEDLANREPLQRRFQPTTEKLFPVPPRVSHRGSMGEMNSIGIGGLQENPKTYYKEWPGKEWSTS